MPAASGSGSYRPSRSQPRSVGKPVTASRPSSSSCQRSSGEETPPAKRQDIATIAIGSSVTAAVTGVRAAGRLPTSSVRRCSASAAGFG